MTSVWDLSVQMLYIFDHMLLWVGLKLLYVLWAWFVLVNFVDNGIKFDFFNPLLILLFIAVIEWCSLFYDSFDL